MKKRIKMLKVKTRPSENDSLGRDWFRMKRRCRGWLAQATRRSPKRGGSSPGEEELA